MVDIPDGSSSHLRNETVLAREGDASNQPIEYIATRNNDPADRTFQQLLSFSNRDYVKVQQPKTKSGGAHTTSTRRRVAPMQEYYKRAGKENSNGFAEFADEEFMKISNEKEGAIDEICNVVIPNSYSSQAKFKSEELTPEPMNAGSKFRHSMGNSVSHFNEISPMSNKRPSESRDEDTSCFGLVKPRRPYEKVDEFHIGKQSRIQKTEQLLASKSPD